MGRQQVAHGLSKKDPKQRSPERRITGQTPKYVSPVSKEIAKIDARTGGMRRLAHLDEYQHSSPVPLALFLMMFFIVGMVVLRFTRSSAEPTKRSRKAKANDAMPRNSPVELSF